MRVVRSPLIAILLFFAWLAAAAVEARVVRVASFNIENGPGAPGTTDYAATKDVVARINADVVGFQELLGTNEVNWRSIAQELNYPHVTFGTNRTSMSGNQRLGYFSRFPIVQTNEVIYSNEVSRVPLNVVIQVPGAAKPLVVWNMHHKADDPGAPHVTYTNRNNQLRRAVETLRIVQNINTYRSNNPTPDEFVMLGDLNDDIAEASAGQALEFSQADYIFFKTTLCLVPSSFIIGPDIQFPIQYRSFPDDRYGAAGGGLHRLDLRQQNGSSRVTRPASNRTLDYILVSTALRDSPLGAPQGEVYNSQLDASFAGLPKAGSLLAAGTSLAASDHLALFADIHMDDAVPASSVASFSPPIGVPGASVIIEGLMLSRVTSVRFGGVEADFTVLSESQITAIVPTGAVDGVISVSGPDGNASSVWTFYVAALPTVAGAAASPSSLQGFSTVAGAVSAVQSFTVYAAGVGGPFRIYAPPGFEVSLDGSNFVTNVVMSAPPRSDAATNYTTDWTAGSNGGSGFAPWTFVTNNGQNGLASAYLGNPADSGVVGMGSKAFALRAEPVRSVAFADVIRALDHPLAVGEAISFDWGVNWDANDANAEKGLAVKSGFAAIAGVHQAGYPGPIVLRYGTNEIDTGLAYGTNAMRWTFRQLDAQTLHVTSTARTNSNTVAFSTNIPVPGAITGFMWFAFQMDSHINRRSYYDNLDILPIALGGGAISQSNVFVRLAANASVGAVSGALSLSCAGQSLASVALSGTVTGATNAYDAWAQSHGLDPQSNGARAADADSDGHSNLREFLFGSLPTQPTGSLWRHEMQPSGLVLTFFARESDASYKLMSSGNLAAGTWSEEALEIAETQDQTGVPLGYKRRHVVVPNPSGDRFFRLQAVESLP